MNESVSDIGITLILQSLTQSQEGFTFRLSCVLFEVMRIHDFEIDYTHVSKLESESGAVLLFPGNVRTVFKTLLNSDIIDQTLFFRNEEYRNLLWKKVYIEIQRIQEVIDTSGDYHDWEEETIKLLQGYQLMLVKLRDEIPKLYQFYIDRCTESTDNIQNLIEYSRYFR